MDLTTIDLIDRHLRGLVHHLGIHAHTEDTYARQLHAVAVQEEVDELLADGVHGRRQLCLVDTGVLRRILQHVLTVDLRVGDGPADIPFLVQDSDSLESRIHFHFAHRFTIIKR